MLEGAAEIDMPTENSMSVTNLKNRVNRPFGSNGGRRAARSAKFLASGSRWSAKFRENIRLDNLLSRW